MAGHVPNNARKTAKELFDGYHADLHDGALKIAEHPRLERHGIGEFVAQRILGKVPAELVQRLLQHRLPYDQLTKKIENIVDSLRVNTEDVIGAAGAAISGCTRRIVIFFCAFRALCGWRGHWSPLFCCFDLCDRIHAFLSSL